MNVQLDVSFGQCVFVCIFSPYRILFWTQVQNTANRDAMAMHSPEPNSEQRGRRSHRQLRHGF